MPSSMSAHASIAAPACSSARADLCRAVSVGVGLDDGDDRRAAAGDPVGREKAGDDRAEVGAWIAVEIDAGRRFAGRTVTSAPRPCARFSNRVCSLMKASFAVPTGPLRCLPMMISAVPSASWFGCRRRRGTAPRGR